MFIPDMGPDVLPCSPSSAVSQKIPLSLKSLQGQKAPLMPVVFALSEPFRSR